MKTFGFIEVGQYLNSNDFIMLLSKYDTKKEDISSVANLLTGISIDYVNSFAHRGATSREELEEILNGVMKKKSVGEKFDIKAVFKKKLLRDLELNKKEELTFEEDFKAKTSAIELFGFHRTKFHAFNGAFLDSIKENGISPDHKSNESEKTEIDQLLSKYGISNKQSIKADNGAVSYSRTASVSFDYAQSSPEWFARLCGDSQNNYRNNDYDKSREEIERLTRDYEFSSADRDRMLELFETCWNSFANKSKYLAIIPEKLEPTAEQVERTFQSMSNFDFDTTYNLLYDLMVKGATNDRSSVALDVSNATFITLPSIVELQQKVEQVKNNRSEESISY